MATGKLTLVIDYAEDTDAMLAARVDRQDKADSLRRIISEITGALGGNKRCRMFACVSSVFASTTVSCAFASAVANTDTLTIAGTALAAKASVATESQFLIGATNNAYAVLVAACINAHSVLQKIVWARVTADGVFTIYSKVPGPIGNLITLAEAGNGFTLGASALAGGASDEMDEYTFGYVP